MSKMTDNYKKHKTTNPLQKFFINNFYKVLLDDLKELKPKSILDVGCGEGFTLERLRNRKIGDKLEGVDFLDAAIELGKKEHPNITLKKASIYALPYRDNSFDTVLCSEVLEHLEFPEKALEELVRVSSKYVVLSVPNEPIFRIANFLRGKNLSRWGNDIEHVNHWTTGQFEEFLRPKLSLYSVKTPFPWTFVIAVKK